MWHSTRVARAVALVTTVIVVGCELDLLGDFDLGDLGVDIPVFSASQTVEITVSGTTTSRTVTFAGTYTLNGTAIALTSEGETFSGSIKGNTLTVIDDGFAFVYQK